MGRQYSFDVNSSTTVKQLRDQLAAKLGLPVDGKQFENMVLIYNREAVDDDSKSLSDYEIEAESYSVLYDCGIKIARADLGIKFVDVSNNTNMNRYEWEPRAPRWRIATNGLCLEGKCTNTTCEAYNKMVIIRIGYEKFDMLNDPDTTTTVCPMKSCRNYVEPVTCAFANCWWRSDGKKVANANSNNRVPTQWSSDWKWADDAYHRFQETDDNTVTWRRLIIEARKEKPE